MQYAKVKDGVIIHIIATTDPEELFKPCNNVGCEGAGVWDVSNPMPNDNEAHVGDDVRKFTPDWKLRPIQDLVDAALITLAVATEADPVPTGVVLEKVENNTIVAKTRYDFAKDGVVELQPLEYLDDEAEQIKQAESVQALLDLGKIGSDEAVLLQSAEVREARNLRLEFVDALATHALRWAALSDIQRQRVADYRQALLDIPQQSGFPWEVTWPVAPE